MDEQTQNIKFVGQIKRYPFLYNYKLPEYSRKDVVDEGWKKVGREMNMTVEACKKRWKNLRAVLARHIKTPPNGSKARKPYYLTNVMQFVLPFIKIGNPREPWHLPPISPENITESGHSPSVSSQQNDDSEEFLEAEVKAEATDLGDLPTRSSKSEEHSYLQHRQSSDEAQRLYVKYPKRRREREYSFDDDNNPRKMFLLSLLPEINEMTESQMKLFKRRALGLIDDITSIPDNAHESVRFQMSARESPSQGYAYYSD